MEMYVERVTWRPLYLIRLIMSFDGERNFNLIKKEFQEINISFQSLSGVASENKQMKSGWKIVLKRIQD